MKASETLETRPSSYRWVVMSTFSIVHATGVVGALVLGILLPSMTEELGLSPSEQGWLGSSALIGALIFSVPFGWWLSRYNAKTMTTISLVVAVLGVVVQGWAPTFTVLLVGRLIYGLTSAAREPARVILVRQWLPQREVMLSNSVLNAALGIAVTGGFALTPLILNAFDDDWRNTLYAFALLTAGLAAAWVLLGRENIPGGQRRREASNEGTPLQGLFKYREPWLIGIGMVGYSIAQMAQYTFWPTFMKDTFDMSLVLSGSILGVLGLVIATGGVVVMPFVSRVGNKLTFILTGIVLSGAFVGTLLTDSIPALVGMFVISGLARGAFWTMYSTIPFELPGSKPRETAVIQSLMMTMFWGGSVLGPLLVGFVQQATGDLKLALVVSSLFPMLITLAAFSLSGRRRAVTASGPPTGPSV